MTYSKINIDGCDIAFTEVNQSAERTIFFLPGNSVSKAIWHYQLQSETFSGYRMIAMDYPASGDSGVTDESSYTLPGLAKICYAVIEQLHQLSFLYHLRAKLY